MKRIVVYLLTVGLMLGMTACGATQPGDAQSDDPASGDISVITTDDAGEPTDKPAGSQTKKDKTTAGKTDKSADSSAARSTASADRTQSETPGETTEKTKKPSSATKNTTSGTTAPDAEEDTGPWLVKTKYATADRVVADIIASPEKYDIDPTGQRSSAVGIQRALNSVSGIGGGTVWLPAGTYLIDKTITIPAFTTLRGDWQDPDEGKEYGTILKISKALEGSSAPGIITVNGSAGAMGLTVWFPDQRIDAVKEYPAVFYVAPGTLLQTVQNVTFINAYVGIRTSASTPHEMLTVDTVKGTVLHAGAEAACQADVGTWKNVTFNSRYWAEAGKSMNTATKAQIETYPRKHATGIEAADLEWTEFIHISLSGFRYGFHIVTGRRNNNNSIQFSGSLYDVTVADCDYGIRADNMDNRWGMVVAASTIGGSEYAIYNNSKGTVKMSGVTLKGATSGTVAKANGNTAAVAPNTADAPLKPGDHFEVLTTGCYSKEDCGAELQKLLDKTGNAGGGVVYLPAGVYTLTSRVRVPAGVELRGASSVAVRGVGNVMGGTTLVVQVGKTDAANADKADAVITLTGKGAGVRGLQMVWPDEITSLDQSKSAVPWCYAIRGKAANVYAINVCLAGAYNGVDFTGCDRHYIKRLVSCCLHNTMTLGGSGGTVECCLQNATVIARMKGGMYFTAINEGNLFTHVFDPVTRVNTTYIRLASNAQNTTIYNTFAYGVNTLIHNDGATGTKLINVGADNLGGSGYLIKVPSGSLTGVNLMRWNGKSYTGSGTIHLYNRLTINDKNEADI